MVTVEQYIRSSSVCAKDPLCDYVLCSARRVQERLLIQAIAGKSLVKEKVMSIDVCCDFTEPTLRIEPEKLDFEVTVVSRW